MEKLLRRKEKEGRETMKLKELLWRRKRVLAFFADASCVIASYWLSFVAGLGGLGGSYAGLFVKTLPAVFACRLFFFRIFRLHRGSWRYASVADLGNILKAVASSQALIAVLLFLITRLQSYPRRIMLLDALILIFLLGGARLTCRMVCEKVRGRGGDKERPMRTLIIGAGEAGEAVARSLRYGNHGSLFPIGFLDDDPAKARLMIHGIRVLGKLSDLPAIIKRRKVDDVIIAIPSATPALKKRVFAACEQTQVRVKTVPNVHDLIVGRRRIDDVSDLDVEDLLGRDAVNTNIEKVSGYLKGKRVLVTGAGGSIGGEICTQIIAFGPESLIMLGKGENSLHDVRLQLAAKATPTKVYCVLGSVTNKAKMSAVFGQFRPEVVFHAAAHKHVDLTELNCDEAVLNNVMGTRNVLEASEEYGAEKVVVISTDKAADPTSVMGCTKRIVEMMVSSWNRSSTSMAAVRFCNVLDSRGSVIPTFRRQIELGGPVTITDKRMKRYFMTIPEAVELVIQAGAIGKHGEVLMLDMGEPVKIVDLAKQMIRLAGYVEGRDIRIEYTGIRPGEKLEEQLVGQSETPDETEHPSVRRITFGPNGTDRVSLQKDIEYLIEKSIGMELDKVREKLMEMVPEYNPNLSQETLSWLPWKAARSEAPHQRIQPART
jgi:FlaA1/EpsC-like NDP-sugar epimerase